MIALGRRGWTMPQALCRRRLPSQHAVAQMTAAAAACGGTYQAAIALPPEGKASLRCQPAVSDRRRQRLQMRRQCRQTKQKRKLLLMQRSGGCGSARADSVAAAAVCTGVRSCRGRRSNDSASPMRALWRRSACSVFMCTRRRGMLPIQRATCSMAWSFRIVSRWAHWHSSTITLSCEFITCQWNRDCEDMAACQAQQHSIRCKPLTAEQHQVCCSVVGARGCF